jgi:hypothetical protein
MIGMAERTRGMDEHSDWAALVKGAHLVEHIVWCVCFTVTLSMLLSTTLGHDFPAKSRALVGLGITVGFVFMLALFALKRVWDEPKKRAFVLVPLRIVLGVPLIAFFAVASAAGFAA